MLLNGACLPCSTLAMTPLICPCTQAAILCGLLERRQWAAAAALIRNALRRAKLEVPGGGP